MEQVAGGDPTLAAAGADDDHGSLGTELRHLARRFERPGLDGGGWVLLGEELLFGRVVEGWHRSRSTFALHEAPPVNRVNQITMRCHGCVTSGRVGRLQGLSR